MKVTYIYHSCFCIELEKYILIFDYYKGELPKFNNKEIIVFVSHKHYDHYSEKIWDLEKQYTNITYILYKDVSNKQQDNIQYVECNKKYRIKDIEVETLTSTDEGCAYIINVEEKQFYHAGDLNWWYWEGEKESDNIWHEKAFKQEIKKLEGKHFSCAFLPLDPRQEENAWWGFLEVLNCCKIDYIFPMHYGNEREKMLEYLELPELEKYKDKIVTKEIIEI